MIGTLIILAVVALLAYWLVATIGLPIWFFGGLVKDAFRRDRETRQKSGFTK